MINCHIEVKEKTSVDTLHRIFRIFKLNPSQKINHIAPSNLK